MHRFYAFHSFTHFHRNGIAAASLFLAAKVEEQPRKLEHVIKVAHLCLSTEFPHAASDVYNEQAQDLVFNENVLLQTLGFDVAIDHPHTHVVKTCHLVKGKSLRVKIANMQIIVFFFPFSLQRFGSNFVFPRFQQVCIVTALVCCFQGTYVQSQLFTFYI